jgi:hypothetical protein
MKSSSSSRYAIRYINQRSFYLPVCKHPAFTAFYTISITFTSSLNTSAIAFTNSVPDTYPVPVPNPSIRPAQTVKSPTPVPETQIQPETIVTPEFSQPKSQSINSSAQDLLPKEPTPSAISPIPSAQIPTAPITKTPIAVLESITTDFRNDADRNGLRNRIIESTAQFSLQNDDKLRIKTGLDSFRQQGVDTITNIPLQVGWDHKIGDATLKVGGGIDTFNRLPVASKLNVGVELPIHLKKDEEGKLVGGAIVSGLVDYGAYKFNARTLEHKIKVIHIKPSVYWQIDPDTSLYAQYQLGLYNDSNVEHQVVSRLERKIGKFFVAANLFAWNYKFDAEQRSGYFSPQDFLTYNGEVGWEGSVFKTLNCRVSANLGQQRLRSEYSNATNYQARCTVPISPNVEADLGYQLTNVRNRTASSYTGDSLNGQLRWKF